MSRLRSLFVGLLVLGTVACSSAADPSLATFCAAYADYERFGSEDSPDQNDPVQVQASFEGTRTRIESIRDAAPSEITDDVSTLIQQFDDVQRMLEGADFDLAAVRDEVSAVFDEPENTAAREAVGAFNADHCSDGSPIPEPSVPIGSTPAPADDPCEVAFYVGSQWQYFDEPDPGDDASAWELKVDSMLSNLRSTQDAVPDELVPVLDVLVASFEALQERWSEADWDPAIADDLHELDETSFLDARAEFDDYNAEVCSFGDK